MIEAGQPKGVEQPKEFSFTAENMARAKAQMAKYPDGKQQSAIMALLHIAQEQKGWLPTAAIAYCADLLDMPQIRAFEVASFYTMYHRRPVGKHHIQVCTSGPCYLRGSDEILEACRRKTGVHHHEVSPDGKFSVEEVECLGACVNAPMLQINNNYFEDLTVEQTEDLIDCLAHGGEVQHGSQTGRQCSCAWSGPTTLKEAK